MEALAPVIALAGTVLLLNVIQMATVAAFLALPVLAPRAAADLGLDPALIGAFTALVYVGMMAATTAGGGLVGRIGALRVSQLALAFSAAGLALAASGLVALLPAAAVLLGVGLGAPAPASSQALFRRTPPARLAMVMGMKETAVPLGGVAAGALLPPAAFAIGWPGAMLALALLCLGGALALQPLREWFDADRDPGRKVSVGLVVESVRMVWRHPGLRELALAGAAFGALQWSFSAFFVTYQVTVLGTPLVEAGLVFALAQAGGAAGRVVWGLVADRLGAPRVLGALGLAMATAAMVLALASPAWPAALVAAAGFVLGVNAIGWTGAFHAEVARLAPAGEVARATGGATFIIAGTVLAAPAAFSGLVALTGGYAAGFTIAALAAGWRGLALLGRGRAP